MQNPSFHRAVLDASRSVTSVIGIDGSVMFASRGVQDMLGYPATWAEGRNILDYIHPEDVSRVVESLALADDNREIRYIPMTLRIRDNEENWVEIDIVSSNRIKLQRAASRDTLTDLFNRSEFVKELTRQNLGAKGSRILFIDLDDFKAINDQCGHNVGDIALVTIAQNIQEALPEHGVACRMGGDEFVIVTPSSIDAKALAQSLIVSCAEPFTTDPEPLTVSASIGVAQIRENDTLEQAIQRADIALLQAKQEGKHRLASCD